MNKSLFTNTFALFQVTPILIAQFVAIGHGNNQRLTRHIPLATSLHIVVSLLHLSHSQRRTVTKQLISYSDHGAKRITRLWQSQLRNTSTLSMPHRKLLDKPNVNRLIELTVHTIPKMGHMRHASGMLMEKTPTFQANSRTRSTWHRRLVTALRCQRLMQVLIWVVYSTNWQRTIRNLPDGKKVGCCQNFAKHCCGLHSTRIC